MSQSKGAGSVLSFATGSLSVSRHIVEKTQLAGIAVSFGALQSPPRCAILKKMRIFFITFSLRSIVNLCGETKAGKLRETSLKCEISLFECMMKSDKSRKFCVQGV